LGARCMPADTRKKKKKEERRPVYSCYSRGNLGKKKGSDHHPAGRKRKGATKGRGKTWEKKKADHRRLFVIERKRERHLQTLLGKANPKKGKRNRILQTLVHRNRARGEKRNVGHFHFDAYVHAGEWDAAWGGKKEKRRLLDFIQKDRKRSEVPRRRLAAEMLRKIDAGRKGAAQQNERKKILLLLHQEGRTFSSRQEKGS